MQKILLMLGLLYSMESIAKGYLTEAEKEVIKESLLWIEKDISKEPLRPKCPTGSKEIEFKAHPDGWKNNFRLVCSIGKLGEIEIVTFLGVVKDMAILLKTGGRACAEEDTKKTFTGLGLNIAVRKEGPGFWMLATKRGTLIKDAWIQIKGLCEDMTFNLMVERKSSDQMEKLKSPPWSKD